LAAFFPRGNPRGAGAWAMNQGQDLSYPLIDGALYLVSFTGRYA
jgi:hypothetical protein